MNSSLLFSITQSTPLRTLPPHSRLTELGGIDCICIWSDSLRYITSIVYNCIVDRQGSYSLIRTITPIWCKFEEFGQFLLYAQASLVPCPIHMIRYSFTWSYQFQNRQQKVIASATTSPSTKEAFIVVWRRLRRGGVESQRWRASYRLFPPAGKAWTFDIYVFLLPWSGFGKSWKSLYFYL